jgi:hypothetical protein
MLHQRTLLRNTCGCAVACWRTATLLPLLLLLLGHGRRANPGIASPAWSPAAAATLTQLLLLLALLLLAARPHWRSKVQQIV